MQTLLYVPENRDIPRGVISSSARRGRRWFDALRVGEVVGLALTTGESLGRAVVTAKELVTYEQCLRTAFDNHVAWAGGYAVSGDYQSNLVSTERLKKALRAGYGEGLDPREPFTKVHLLPLDDALLDAVRVIYYGARWSADRPCDETEMWTRLRDAAGFKPGSSTEKLGARTLSERIELLRRRALHLRCKGDPMHVTADEWFDLDITKSLQSFQVAPGEWQDFFEGAVVIKDS